MNTYMFRQACRPRGDFRIQEISEFLDLVKEAFKCSNVYDSNSKPLDLAESVLQKTIQKKVDKIFPTIGATLNLFTIAPRKWDKNTVRIEIHTGTHPEKIFVDTYDLAIGEGRKVPSFDFFEKSIEIFRPFEAYVEEGRNESRLDAYGKQQAIPKFDKPAIIRGFHYLDKGMVRSIGGIRHSLKAPAWNVKKFCNGVLIELVPGLFDSNDPEHLEIQEEVMVYFNLL
jgi:hypothetical protein